MYLPLESHDRSHYRFDEIIDLLPDDTVLVLITLRFSQQNY